MADSTNAAQQRGISSDNLPAGFVWARCNDWRVAVRSDLAEILSDPDGCDPERMALGGRALFRGRGRPVLTELPGGIFGVLRRYRHGGLLAPLTGSRFFGVPRPLRELLATERARSFGVSVPKVLAAYVRYIRPLQHEGYLLTRRVARARDLAEALEEGTEAGPVLAMVGAQMRLLHDSGIWHADLHVKNVLLTQEGVVLIDFDRARIVDPMPDRLRHANLLRFDRSLVKLELKGVKVSMKERLSLYRGYFTRRPTRAIRSDLINRCKREIRWHRLWWSLSKVR